MKWNWKCHVTIVIKTDLAGLFVTMHWGLCVEYVNSLAQRPRHLTFSFGRTIMLCDNKSLRSGLNPLSYRDHCGYGLSPSETTLHCNVVSHWLSPYPQWSLSYSGVLLLHDSAISKHDITLWYFSGRTQQNITTLHHSIITMDKIGHRSLWTHKRYLLARSSGRAVKYFLLVLFRKLTLNVRGPS